jgi:adenine-specific DNA-methyltransferase
MSRSHQVLPRSGPAREALREKGQFWTPEWVADAMVSYVIAAGSEQVFDPAVGAGAFLLAAKRMSKDLPRRIRLRGAELDPKVLDQATKSGLVNGDLAEVEIRDFVLNPPEECFPAIVANPPYIRHHRIDAATKGELRFLAKRLIGKPLDGRTGYHVFFLIRALDRLAENGRLAFIMPADTCEGVFARTLWEWILSMYRLDAVITFSHGAAPFPNVDTNAMIFMISAGPPRDRFAWCRCSEPGGDALRTFVELGFPQQALGPINSIQRQTAEAFETGLSRSPRPRHDGPVLGDFAFSTRGIATGDNGFFFMTKKEALARGLPLGLMVRAVGRTRDIQNSELTDEQLEILDCENRPTYLLSLDSRPLTSLPREVQQYLDRGEESRVSERPLIKQRRPWYKMESRQVPPFLFAYLGRRNARFIRNLTNAVPLTGFLCVYPRKTSSDYIEKLWSLLNHPDTVSNLALVAKSYGSGAIKVEPRALERVPISKDALRKSGLLAGVRSEQFEMAFK